VARVVFPRVQGHFVQVHGVRGSVVGLAQKGELGGERRALGRVRHRDCFELQVQRVHLLRRHKTLRRRQGSQEGEGFP
jgi:hypothetical protein